MRYSHFFSKTFQHICVSLDVNFNESLTNNIVSFEQLGPDPHHLIGAYPIFYSPNSFRCIKGEDSLNAMYALTLAMLNKLIPRPCLIFSQSGYLIKVVDTNSNTLLQTVQIQISWLLQKPTDLDLHCLQRHIWVQQD